MFLWSTIEKRIFLSPAAGLGTSMVFQPPGQPSRKAESTPWASFINFSLRVWISNPEYVYYIHLFIIQGRQIIQRLIVIILPDIVIPPKQQDNASNQDKYISFPANLRLFGQLWMGPVEVCMIWAGLSNTDDKRQIWLSWPAICMLKCSGKT